MKKILKKTLSVILTFNLLLQSYVPFLVTPVYADDSTPSATTLDVTSTPEPTATPTETVTPTPGITAEPTPTATPTIEATPTPTPTPEVTPDPTPVIASDSAVTPTIVVTPTAEITPTTTPNVTAEPTSNPDAQAPPASPDQQSSSDTSTSVPESITIASNLEQALTPVITPTLTTDKADYFPTDIAYISGKGFLPNTTYTLHIMSSDMPYVSYKVEVTSDETGRIFYAYQLDGHYRPHYSIDALDASGTVVSSMTFTDSRSVNSATVNGSSSTTVASGESVTVSLTVHGGGSGSDNWNSTKYTIEGQGAQCVNTTDHPSDTNTESFSVTAPSTLGSYDLTLVAYENDGCSGGSDSLTLHDAIIVSPSWPTSWTTPSQCSTDPAGEASVSPAQVDLVGDTSNPAVGYAVDGTYRFFRERLNGDPSGSGGFGQSAWVTLFQTSSPKYQYLGVLNGKDDKVQLYANTSVGANVDFNPLFNDPAEDPAIWEGDASTYARIVNAGSGKYYVDWAIPLTAFSGTGIGDGTTKYFATSDNENNYNKDHLDCYNSISDVSIAKSDSPDPVTSGGTLTYTITVTNNGPDQATGVTVSDTLPAGFSLTSVSSSQGSCASMPCNLGNINNGSFATITIVGTVSGSGTITNTASVTSTTLDNDTSNNSASADTTINIATRTLTVQKTTTPSGDTTSFSISASGTGTITGGGTGTISDSTDKVYTVTAGTYSVTETVPAGWAQTGNTCSDVVISSSDQTCLITNIKLNPSLNVAKSSTTLEITTADQVVPYTFTVTNTGNQILTGVTVSDPKCTSIISGPSGDTNSDSKLDLTETWIYSCNHTVTQGEVDAGGNLSNTVTADSTESSSDTDTLDIPVTLSPSLDVTKKADKTSVSAAGNVIGYTVEVTNTGNQTLTGVSISDLLLSNLDCDTVFGSPFTTSGLTINVGSKLTCYGSYTVLQSDIDNNGGGDGKIDNTVTADSTQTDSKTASQSVAVTQDPAINVAKSSTTLEITTAGQVVPYSFSVTNTGNQTLTDITVTDPKCDATPAYVSGDTNSDSKLDLTETWIYSCNHTVTQTEVNTGGNLSNTVTADSTESAPDTDTKDIPVSQTKSMTVEKSSTTTTLSAPGTVNYSYLVTNTGNVTLTGISLSDNNDNDDMSCPATTLAPLGTMTCTATHDFTQTELDAGGTLDNTVTATSNEAPEATDSLRITISLNPSLSVTKVANKTSVSAAGNVIGYTVEVSNTGNQTLTGVSVSDPLLPDLDCDGTFAEPYINSGLNINVGGKLTCYGVYTVTQDNINDNGGGDGDIDNTVTTDSTETGTDTASVAVIITGSIAGYKTEDQDGNISTTSDRNSVSDWGISLWNWVSGDWSHLSDTTTATDGSYSFTGLLPDQYRVREEMLSGWTNLTSKTVDVTLSAGQNSTDNNFLNTTEENDKVTLCHSTDSETNTFNKITVSSSAAYHAHLGGSHQSGRDIIPSFTYKGEPYSQNWDALGQATYRNNCDGNVYGSITVRKYINNTENRAGSGWEFNIDGSTYSTDSTGSTETVKVIMGTNYSATESAVLDGYKFKTAYCFNSTGGYVGTLDSDTHSVNGITVGKNDDVTCNFTNTQLGKIIIKKVTNLEEDQTKFNFDASYNDGFSLAGGEQNDSGYLTPGEYSVSEGTLPEGWQQTRATCDNEDNPNEIMLNAGETVTCTFTNEYSNPEITIRKSNDAGSDKNPGDAVTYKIKLHISGANVKDLKVRDLLPKGFKYRAGSAKVNGGPLLPEPVYASPGKWNLGNFNNGDNIELEYIADISGDQKPGIYKDVATAQGTSLAGEVVFALADDSSKVDTNYVATSVKVVKDQTRSDDYGVEKKETVTGQVLGASTDLPATGANELWLLTALLSLYFGYKLVKTSK